jgi:hypothetical protein
MQRIPIQIDLVGVVDEAVEDGVGQRGVTDGGMPVINRKLAGHDRRARAVPVVEHLQQIAAVHVVEDSEPPVIDHDHINPGQLLTGTVPSKIVDVVEFVYYLRG